MLEPAHPQLTLKVQTELLGMSYSSLFYRPVPPAPREIAIKHRIDRIYTEHPYYGSCVLKSHHLLTGESPALVAVRRPGSRQPVHLGDRVC
jgi:hypothetical protein